MSLVNVSAGPDSALLDPPMTPNGPKVSTACWVALQVQPG